MNYYSVQTFLGWCLNHYFYRRLHHSYVAAPFHTYKNANPTSSNPWHLYGDQYEPWWDGDPYAAHVRNARRGLEAGVIAQRNRGQIGWALSMALIAVAQRAHTRMLYPIVYRVDLHEIDESRREKAGSGAETASDEWLIRDLSESEFEVLFFDPSSDRRAMNSATAKLGAPLVGNASVPAAKALRILQAEIQP